MLRLVLVRRLLPISVNRTHAKRLDIESRSPVRKLNGTLVRLRRLHIVRRRNPC
jgi:hypothetical protein